MAAESSPATVPSVSEEEQAQETAIENSLARLQEMHVALRHLRDTIPRVVGSIQEAETTSDPAEFYAQFSNAAAGAGKDIQEFMRMMRDERAKEVFDQVKKSRDADGEGIEVWRVTEHEDWLDVTKEVKVEELDDEGDGPEQGVGHQPEDRKMVVESFRTAHPAVEVDLGEIVTVKLPSPVDFIFSLTEEDEDKDRHSWKVTGITRSNLQPTKLTKSILESSNGSGRKFRDLGSILGMVASYSDVTTRPCTKCKRPIDRSGQLPVVRSRKRTKQPDGQTSTEWVAFHQACT